MQHDTRLIETAAQKHPLLAESSSKLFPVDSTVGEIVLGHDLDPKYGLPTVTLFKGGDCWEIPPDRWDSVTPKPDARVEIHYKVNGGPIAAFLFPAAAAAVNAGTATLGATLLISATSAAVSVLAGLALRALIPPPQQRDSIQSNPNFAITGTSNRIAPHQPYPKVFGRHLMYPVKTATGFTETVNDDEIYHYARMTFGYGTVAIEDLRIGPNPIHQFSDVELEFLNVDQAETLARYPELAGITRAWRTGSETLELYPNDIAEDGYNDGLTFQNPVIRNTRLGAQWASVDLLFPRGVGEIKPEGDIRARTITFDIEYRAAGSSDAWTLAHAVTEQMKSRDPLRRSYRIDFPAPGEYEIRITRTREDTPDAEEETSSFLSAIRSVRPGQLPSHPEIAEVAMRIRASEQLNGVIDSANAVVQQMGQAFNEGTQTWSLQPVRHPAWQFLDALQGNHMANPVPAGQIIEDAAKAWASEEPHWTFDYVVDTDMRLADVLDLICSAGRAKRSLTDLKYSMIRDGGAGPIRQMYTPRNSWNFKWSRSYGRAIHAFRVRVRSEAQQDWGFDQFEVYRDGYDASNATKFETLELPGVVIESTATDQGNAWKLARYHLAQYVLRPSVFEWETDWEALRNTRGDKVLITHDAILAGGGQGLIKSIDTGANVVVLDDDYDLTGDHRLTARRQDGSIIEWTAQRIDTGGGVFGWSGAGFSALNVGDLVTIHPVAVANTEVLITEIYPDPDGGARIVGVPAAPEVLNADTGGIPPYTPPITSPPSLVPPVPVIVAAWSDDTTAERDRNDVLHPRIRVQLQSFADRNIAGAQIEIRWREAVDGTRFVSGEPQPFGTVSLVTGRLEVGLEYIVQVRAVNAEGRSSDWVEAPFVTASLNASPPGDVTNFAHVVQGRGILLTWDKEIEGDLQKFQIRLGGADWETGTVYWEVPGTSRATTVPGVAGTFRIKAIDYSGRESVTAAQLVVTPEEIAIGPTDLNSQLQDAFGEFLPGFNFFDGLTIEVFNDFVRGYTAALFATAEKARDVAVAAVDEDRADTISVVEDLLGDLGDQQQRILDFEQFAGDETSTLALRVQGVEAQLTNPENNQSSLYGLFLDIVNLDLDPGRALVQSLTSLEARADNIESVLDPGNPDSYAATVDTTLSAKVDANEAIAAIEGEISASYNDLTTFASESLIAKATRDQILSGVMFRANGGSVELVSIADVDANGIASAPVVTLDISTDIVRIKNLTQMEAAVIGALAADAGFIGNLTVDRLNLAGNSVTVHAHSTGSSKVGDDTFKLMTSVSFNLPEAADLTIGWFIEQGYSGLGDWGVRVSINHVGIALDRDGMTFGTDYPSGVFGHSSGGSGATSVQLFWKGEPNMTGRGSLVVLARWR